MVALGGGAVPYRRILMSEVAPYVFRMRPTRDFSYHMTGLPRDFALSSSAEVGAEDGSGKRPSP